MDEKKWIKYLIYRYKLNIYPKKKIISKFPVYLLVEPTSVCNLRCVMCFQIDKSFTKKPFMGFMNFNLFKKIIDEASSNGTSAITLASRGEPLLHPKISQMIKYISKKKNFIDVKLNTNATKLNEKLCHEILNSNINIVVITSNWLGSGIEPPHCSKTRKILHFTLQKQVRSTSDREA